MGKLIYFLCFILSVFPADANENRRHIHVTRKGRQENPLRQYRSKNMD